jgi:peptide/nickel transport system permease protein
MIIQAKLKPTQWLGLMLFSLVATMALAAPLLAPVDSSLSPFNLSLANCDLPPGSHHHLLGTDHLGRDVLSLSMWGARASLTVGICSALIAVTLGAFWGATSAFAGGLTDAFLMRVVDVCLSVPGIILLLVADALLADLPYRSVLPKTVLDVLGINSYSDGALPILTVVLVIAVTTWLEAARLTRARVLSTKTEEFIIAAEAIGLGGFAIIVKHLLPNASNIIFLEGTLLVSDAIQIEAGLSFLGLGLGPSTPSWGSMLNSAQVNLVAGNWWSVVVPGTLIAVTVLAIQLLTQRTNR